MEKRLMRIIVAVALLLCPVLPGVSSLVEADAAAKVQKQLQTVVFKTHLHCENCVKKVMANISYVKGVEDLKVSLEKQTITVTFNANKTDADKIAKEIVDLGYPAIKVNTQQQ